MCEWVLALGNELRQEMQQQPVGWQDVLRANLVRLLSMLQRTWGYTPSQAQQALDPSHMNRIIPVLEGVAAAPERQLDVREAAESCHMSVRHFSRIFSRTMGIGFHQFCLQARLAYVERQLMATDATIAVLADAAGFANTGHLCRSFVKHFGLRPTEYRAHFGRKEPMPEP
jgi:transcriptional regulator GlxA family with amidase domain